MRDETRRTAGNVYNDIQRYVVAGHGKWHDDDDAFFFGRLLPFG